jgi:hypothetical protein
MAMMVTMAVALADIKAVLTDADPQTALAATMTIAVTMMAITVMGAMVAITGFSCRSRERTDADQCSQRQCGAS